MGFVAFQVLVFIVEDHMAPCHGESGVVVVLNVIRLEAQAAESDFDVSVSQEEATHTALCAARGDRGYFAGPGRKAHLLGKAGFGAREPEKREKEKRVAGSRDKFGRRYLHAAFRLSETKG